MGKSNDNDAPVPKRIEQSAATRRATVTMTRDWRGFAAACTLGSSGSVLGAYAGKNRAGGAAGAGALVLGTLAMATSGRGPVALVALTLGPVALGTLALGPVALRALALVTLALGTLALETWAQGLRRRGLWRWLRWRWRALAPLSRAMLPSGFLK